MDTISGLDEIQLSELRWKLQDDIGRNLKENKEDSPLQGLISLHNKIIDVLRELDSRRRFDPFERLPGEIFLKIIFVICRIRGYWYPYVDIEQVLTLSMVSRKWQRFILSEPLLWNFISLDNFQDMHARLSLQLDLSRDLPLTIAIKLPLEGWEFIKLDLISHHTRIYTIVLDVKRGIYHNYDTRRHANDIRKFLDDMGHLPNLRRLGSSFGHSDELYDIKEVLHRFPSLMEMPGVVFTANDLRLAKDRLNMHTLTTYEDPKIVLPMAQTAIHLKGVHLMSNGLLLDATLQEEFQTGSTLSLTTPLHWTILTHQRYWDPIPVSFLSRLSSLVSLDMWVRTKAIYDVANIVHQLHNLYEVRLHLRIHSNDQLSSPTRLAPNVSVQSLELKIVCRFHSDAQQHNGDFDNKISAHIDEIASTLLRVMPKLRVNTLATIAYNTYARNTYPLFLFDGTFNGNFNGEKLNLTFQECKLIPKGKSPIPSSVHDLDVYLHGRDSFDFLGSKFIKKLTISLYNAVTETRKSGKVNMIDLELWPSLESFRIVNGIVQWSRSSLVFLRNVVIGNDFIPTVHNASTSFLRDIACRPESYPSLEEITLHGILEYDILMIMLERRNLLTGSSIKKITKLHLIKPYPSQICLILLTLLECKWIERPRNRELSLAGNAEIILDLSLPGCYACHRRFRPCNAPVRIDQPPMTESERHSILERLQEYPISNDEILETWDARVRLWDTLNKDGGGRVKACSNSHNWPKDISFWE